MNTPEDCVVIDVSNGVVCPMCSNCVSLTEMAESCPKKIDDHQVCNECMENLKTYGFDGGCSYCGYRSKDNNNVIVAAAQNTRLTTPTVVVVRNNHRDVIFSITLDKFCILFFGTFIIVLSVFGIYYLGNLFYTMGQMIDHSINKEDHSHDLDPSMKHCVIGYTGCLMVVYILSQIIWLIAETYNCYVIPCIRRIRNLTSNNSQ